jgi:hypothetical protein
MCGACGILAGGADWTDPVEGPLDAGRPRLAERQRRIALVNVILAFSGVRLAGQGGQLIVRSPTGRTKIVTDLAHVWPAAEWLGHATIDPLNDDVLAMLAAGGGDRTDG